MSKAASGVARGAVVSLAGQWAKYVVQLAAVVVFSRLLDPGEIGLVAAATAVTGVAWVLSDFGLSLAALQAEELSQDQKSMLFWTNSAIGAIITALVCALSPLIAAFYDEPRVVAVVAAGSVCFFLSGLNSQFEVTINREGRFGVLAAIGVTAQSLGLITGAAIVLFGGSYWGLVVSPIVVSIVTLFGSIVCSRWWPSRPRRGVPMRHLYRFGGQTLGLHLVTYITYNADSVLIGRSLGTEQLGFYNRAYQLSQVPALQLASPLTKVFLPALSRCRNEIVAYADLAKRIQLFLGYVLAGGLAFMAVEAEAVVDIALGSGWDQAVPVLRILCIAAVLEILGKLYYWMTLSHAKAGLLFWAELGPRIITVALIIALVPHGITVVAWALVVGQGLALALGAFIVVPAVGLRIWPFLGLLLRPMLVIVAASGATAYLQHETGSFGSVVDLVMGLAVWLVSALIIVQLPFFRADLGELKKAAASFNKRRAVSAGK